MYIDIDGKGFQLESTYDKKPQPAILGFKAQTKIRELQQKVAAEQRRASAKEHGFEEEEDDFDWDSINDDLKEGEKPFVEPPLPSDEEMNSRLRDK